MSDEKSDKFDKVFENANAPRLGADKKRLERVYNEERSNLIKLRHDVGSAITVDKQLERQLKNLKRKHFENGGTDPEIAALESRLIEHRKVKDALKSQLAEREAQLQAIYDEKPGVFGAILSEPKNAFALIVLLVIITALAKIL